MGQHDCLGIEVPSQHHGQFGVAIWNVLLFARLVAIALVVVVLVVVKTTNHGLDGQQASVD